MTRNPLPIPVEPGQVRRDPDPRHKGARTVTVQVVGGRHVSVITHAGRHTRILTDALAKWPLVTTETP
jgi:hypothetical protein